jgi:aminoglycoside phosphotransferase (APT) family kinase protein
MQPINCDPLSEPPLARFLRVVRKELSTTIAPELHTERAQRTAEMTALLLDHLIAREEQLAALAAAQLGAAAGLPHDALLGWCAAAEALEELVAQQVMRLREQDTAARHAAWFAIGQAMAQEAALHDGLERAEAAIAADYSRSHGPADFDAAELAAYLRSRDGAAIEVTRLDKILGGYSKDTFIAELAGAGRPAEAIVLRRDLANGPLEGSVADEFAVLAAMHAAGIEVPRPLWVEQDANALGAPLIVTERVPGRQIIDLKLDVVGEGAEDCVRQLARMLAQIHAVDPRRAGVGATDLERPVQQHIRGLLERFEEQWRRRRLGPSPTIAAGFAWMKSNIPDDLPGPVIVHGDATVRNMLFEDGRATALLDWETWHLGDPGEDLAYCRMDVERFMPWAEFLAEYHAHGGKPFSAASERFWSMWVYLRGAVTSVSMMDRLLIDPPPDIRPAFGGPHFVRVLSRKVAEHLLRFKAEESDAAQ